MIHIKKIVILIFFLFVTVLGFALQGPGGPPCPEPPCLPGPPGLPIDTGIIVLIAAGMLYGGYKFATISRAKKT